jgi:hypothetical protein
MEFKVGMVVHHDNHSGYWILLKRRGKLGDFINVQGGKVEKDVPFDHLPGYREARLIEYYKFKRYGI